MEKLQYSKEFFIQTSNTDFKGKATIQSLLHLFQEIAWEHAEILGLGFENLFKHNLIWVLSKQKTRIIKCPNWHDKVIVKTWATGKEGFFWNRDFKIMSDQGEELVKAMSSWLIIDIVKRRPYRGDDLFNLKIENPEKTFDYKLGKVPALTKNTKSFDKIVRYSDLDLNNHVNNVKYLEWVLDGYPIEFFEQNILSSVELNFLAEAIYGDEIEIFSEIDSDNYLHSVKRKSDGKELFRTRIEWVKRK